MPRVYVKFAQFHQLSGRCRSISTDVLQIRSSFLGTIKKLDWDVLYQSDINNTAKRIATRMEAEAKALRGYENFFKDAYNEYLKLDTEEGDLSSFFEAVEFDPNRIRSLGPGGALDSRELWLEWMRELLPWILDTDQDLTDSSFSYLDALYELYSGDKKGYSGADDLFNLADKSIGLWSGFYDYLKSVYDPNGKSSLFSTGSQEKVAALGIFGSLFGMISSLCGSVDNIANTEGIGAAGIIGELLDGGSSAVDVWESIDKLMKVGDNTITPDGALSPLDLYTTTAKGLIAAISQGFTSVDKYSADGEWDLLDTAYTGLEASVEGLYTMVEEVASRLTKGLISEETTGISAESISQGLEKWAGDTGDRAGNYIVNNPGLYEAYNNSAWPGRMVLTFYAAIASR